MGTIDSNGVYFYEDTDAVSPLHTLLNIGQQSVSDALSHRTRGVANTTERNALLTTVGATADKPLIVYRRDTETFEISDGGAFKAFAGGTSANITFTVSGYTGATNAVPRVTREGSRVFADGEILQTGNLSVAAKTFYTIASIPSAFAPVRTVTVPVVSKDEPALIRILPNGAISFAVSYAGTFNTPNGNVLDIHGVNWEKSAG